MSNGFRFSQRSERALSQVHPDLVRVVRTALTRSPLDFMITEGARTIERQRQLVAAGASRTLRSRHIPGKDGFAKAIDFAVLVNGQVRWDWPLYKQVADVFKAVAQEQGVPIIWGGDWRTLRDGPHVELDRKRYP